MDLYTHPGGQVTLMPPPPGYVSDFEHPQRQYVQAIYWAAGVCNVVTFVFMGIRCFTSFRIQTRFAPEDALLIIAWMLVIAHTAMTVRLVANGTMGTHAYELELPRLLDYARNFYPMPIIYPLCCMFAKLSLISFYGRLSSALPYRIAMWSGTLFIVGSMVGLAIATAVPCRPLELAWNPLANGTCIDRPATYESTAIMALLSDIWLMVLPIPTVIRLQIPWQQKVCLMVVFGIGIITIFTSCMRLYFIIEQFASLDMSWGASLPAFWFIIEGYLMILCATLPSIRSFLRHVAPKVLGERSRSGHFPTIRGSNDVLTIGSARMRRRTYQKFEETPYGLEPIPSVNRSSTPRCTSAADKGSIAAGEEPGPTGIIQTRTVSITIGLAQ